MTLINRESTNLSLHKSFTRKKKNTSHSVSVSYIFTLSRLSIPKSPNIFFFVVSLFHNLSAFVKMLHMLSSLITSLGFQFFSMQRLSFVSLTCGLQILNIRGSEKIFFLSCRSDTHHVTDYSLSEGHTLCPEVLLCVYFMLRTMTVAWYKLSPLSSQQSYEVDIIIISSILQRGKQRLSNLLKVRQYMVKLRPQTPSLESSLPPAQFTASLIGVKAVRITKDGLKTASLYLLSKETPRFLCKFVEFLPRSFLASHIKG